MSEPAVEGSTAPQETAPSVPAVEDTQSSVPLEPTVPPTEATTGSPLGPESGSSIQSADAEVPPAAPEPPIHSEQSVAEAMTGMSLNNQADSHLFTHEQLTRADGAAPEAPSWVEDPSLGDHTQSAAAVKDKKSKRGKRSKKTEGEVSKVSFQGEDRDGGALGLSMPSMATLGEADPALTTQQSVDSDAKEQIPPSRYPAVFNSKGIRPSAGPAKRTDKRTVDSTQSQWSAKGTVGFDEPNSQPSPSRRLENTEYVRHPRTNVWVRPPTNPGEKRAYAFVNKHQSSKKPADSQRASEPPSLSPTSPRGPKLTKAQRWMMGIRTKE